jgi:hypothetical protein
MKVALVLIAITGCSKPSYLGASVPKPCTARDAEACLGWMAERDLAAAELDIYDDSELRRYVQQVANRVARASLLDAPPRVLIADRDETYATSGRRIVIARRTLEKLASEAELAAVVAHELAHVEGRHGIVSLFGRPPDEGFVNRRDAEAVADERAVWLLERAGYAPTAMASALRVVLEAEDEEHPLRADRIARVTVLAGGRTGFEGREELLQRLANMVVGRDSRLGRRTDAAWVVSALGITLELTDGDLIRADQDVLALRRDNATLIAYAVGAPWGRELAALVEDREVAPSEVGEVVMGTLPFAAHRDDSPLGKLARAVRTTLPQPAPGSRVAIVVRPKGALVIEIGGRSVPGLLLRKTTDAEAAAAEPARMTIARAPRTGTIAELAVCQEPLDDPDRTVAVGEPLRCSTRAREPASRNLPGE